MYIWNGINVDKQLLEIKRKTKETEERLSFENSNFTLPFHISLKISYKAENDIAQRIKADVIDLYNKTKPIEIKVKGIEYHDTICWIMMKENKELSALHDALGLMLFTKYAVPYHEYDLDYKFHTTLFMDNDAEKVKKAYESVQKCSLPEKLLGNTFLIGSSESGKLGTYRVEKEIIK